MTDVSSRCAGSRNLLLASLSSDDYAALRPLLEIVALQPQRVLHNPGEASKYVYFPRSGFVSVAIALQDGSMVEVAPIGREGLAGIPATGPAQTAMTNALIVVHGEDDCAYRMRIDDFRREMDKCGPFADVVNHYGEAFLGVVMQNTCCNAAHSVEQRMAKWLLMAHDRLETPRFRITQEFLATLLGATRQTVTGVAGALQKKQVIEYSRGELEILDRDGLEAASCECYRVSTRLLQRVATTPAAAS
ncbi:MAG: Crp/Fnr family transcriptional regulator [Cyanobacteria bacterium]|nr:Crp/Fnr family transcriptional regulator [Cyanobacteriota bacterium]